MEKVKVRMLVPTRYNSKPVITGSEIEVDSNTAQRWASRQKPLCKIIVEKIKK
jgi:hypothetical protein